MDFDSGATEPPGVEEKKSWSTGKIVIVAVLGAGAVVGGVLFVVFPGTTSA